MTEMSATALCQFQDQNGNYCPGTPELNGLCRWHDPTIEKGGPKDREALEAWVSEGHSLAGFSLRYADLTGMDLVKAADGREIDFSGADLSHSCLKDAHLYHVNFQNSELLKVNLSGANLNRANLELADLLGVNFHDAHIEHIQWGEQVRQEVAGYQSMRDADITGALDKFREAEEIYRNLRKVSDACGHFENSGQFFYHEMVMRRLQIPAMSIKRLTSKFFDVVCGYGEKPIRILLASLTLILAFSLIFFVVGIYDDGVRISFQWSVGLSRNLIAFYDCFYFSIVTFTTLGYGDLSPMSWMRIVAALEAFVGTFSMALFVFTFVRKMTR